MTIDNLPAIRACRPAWNKGRIVGQKRPLLPKHVWAIRVRLGCCPRRHMMKAAISGIITTRSCSF